METEPAKHSAWPVLLVSLQLGCRSFGGPIAHLGYFERTYVRRLRWLAPEDFAGIIALCQLLPGPTSSQTGFLIGLHRAGWRGALAAWAGFTLPSVLLMYAFYVFEPRLSGPATDIVMRALRWVTVAVVARAVFSMAKALCPDVRRVAIAVLAAAAFCVMHGALAQITVLSACAAAGYFFCRHAELAATKLAAGVPSRAAWYAIVIAVLLLIALRTMAVQMPGGLMAIADIFYRTGALVFGGGHVVLPLLHDALVPAGWISESNFLGGYGAAQALPGPLFSVAAYFGAMSMPPGRAGLGALVAVSCIFLPGMLLAIAGRAVWNRCARAPRLRAALAGVNAGAVGLLAAALYDPVLTGAVA